MCNRKRFLVCLAAALLLLPSATALAGTFGASGEIESTSSVNRTISIGKYTVHVVGTSVMLDEGGRQLSFSELGNIDGNVGFTMEKVGTRWELIRLIVEDEEEDE